MKKRIDIIDALRGLAVTLMVVHHFLFDLVEFLGAPEWLFSNPVFDLLHYVFAGLFIFLSGVSSRFSRSNTKRGLKLALVALAITGVTFLIKMPILFGILHLLSFCMVLYGLTYKFWERIPRAVMPLMCIALTVVGAVATSQIQLGSDYLWPLGWTQPGFYSADYFPILPWVFVFLVGTWAGAYIREGKLPDWFYSAKIPLLPAVGRRALIIYIVHQPVLYGLTMLIGLFV